MIFDWMMRLLQLKRDDASRHASDSDDRSDEDESIDPENPFPEVVIVEIKDVLDLHSIPPRQVRAIVEDYLEEARRRGYLWVRIIHGKGIGVQREIVRSILSRTPFVIDYRDAPQEAGGWGATLVTLEQKRGTMNDE